jgi:hypothetical protein
MKRQLYGRMGRQDVQLKGQNVEGPTSLKFVKVFEIILENCLLSFAYERG